MLVSKTLSNCCERLLKWKDDFHQAVRIKYIAIGAILLLAGIFMASGALGGNFLMLGYICSLIGTVSFTLGFSNKAKRDKGITSNNQAHPNQTETVSSTFTVKAHGHTVSYSSDIPRKEVSCKEYGDESIGRINDESENLIFNGTYVEFAKTNASIELKNGAIIGKAFADYCIDAENCEELGHLTAGGFISLSRCGITCANAGGKIVAESCESIGSLNAGGEVKLTNCSSVREANAGGTVIATGCKGIVTLSAGKEVIINNTIVDCVVAGNNVEVNNSTIRGNLECSGSATVNNSNVNSININSDRMENLNIKDTVIENIYFKIFGKIFLTGNSEIRGKVTNGEIIKV